MRVLAGGGALCPARQAGLRDHRQEEQGGGGGDREAARPAQVIVDHSSSPPVGCDMHERRKKLQNNILSLINI